MMKIASRSTSADQGRLLPVEQRLALLRPRMTTLQSARARCPVVWCVDVARTTG